MMIGICDDEPVVRDGIEGIVKQSGSQIVARQFADGKSLIEYIRTGGEADILFLDIDFGDDSDGMKSAAKIREMMNRGGSKLAALPLIIFVTGFPERMREAFSVHAFDFLVKPFDEKEIADVFTKAVAEVKTIRSEQTRDEMLEVRINGRTLLVPIARIVYIESLGRKIILHSEGNDTEYYGRISDMLPLLGDGFCRVHRSYIINLSFVEDYSRMGVVMSGGIPVPMSKGKYRSFIDEYLSYGSRL